MAHICPWWLTYSFDNPLRKWIHNPEKILSPLVKQGMQVADIGCGMGYFTIPLAECVGPQGHVQAIDIQSQQLKRVTHRALRHSVAPIITTTLATESKLGLNGPFDFVLLFWVAHEIPEQKKLWEEIFSQLKSGGKVLLVEPKGHVNKEKFEKTLQQAAQVGFRNEPYPGKIRMSRAVVLSR